MANPVRVGQENVQIISPFQFLDSPEVCHFNYWIIAAYSTIFLENIQGTKRQDSTDREDPKKS